MSAFLIVATVLLGVLRLVGVTSPFYQAIAHCFVGGLFGAYFAGKKKLHLWLAVSLTILETLAFLATRVLGLF